VLVDDFPRFVEPAFVDVVLDVQLLFARYVHHVDVQKCTRQLLEGDVQVNAHLLVARCVDKQLGAHLGLKERVQLGCKEERHDDHGGDRHCSTREGLYAEVLQRLGVRVKLPQLREHASLRHDGRLSDAAPGLEAVEHAAGGAATGGPCPQRSLAR